MSSVVHQNSGDSPCLRANVACHLAPATWPQAGLVLLQNVHVGTPFPLSLQPPCRVGWRGLPGTRYLPREGPDLTAPAGTLPDVSQSPGAPNTAGPAGATNEQGLQDYPS